MPITPRTRLRSCLIVLGLATAACLAERGPLVNRMAHAGTSYLERAARQPVNWQPWSREAFALAAKLDRPVLLYVGSDGCHWCAETDRAIYTDPEIGSLINTLFVPIRVDRDERPDVALRYQAAVERLAGLHGWPLTVFLTADGAPFFGGTYFPGDDPVTGRGLKQLLPEIAQRYRDQRPFLVQQASRIRQLVLRGNSESRGLLRLGAIERGIAGVARALDAAVQARDVTGSDVKAGAVSLLLLEYARARDTAALAVARRALDAMLDTTAASSGEDPPPLVRASLAGALAQAWVVTGETRYRDAGRAQVRDAARDLPDLAAGAGIAVVKGSGGTEVFTDQLAYMIEKVMLAAATLSEASAEQRARGELDALLQRAAGRRGEMERGEGVRHSIAGASAMAGGVPLGFLQDQVQLASACLAAYQLTTDRRYLTIAQDLAAVLDSDYADPAGGFYDTAATSPSAPAAPGVFDDRMKSIFDDVLPGANALAASVLTRLAVATGNATYRRRAQATLEAFAGGLANAGAGLRITTFLAAARENLATP